MSVIVALIAAGLILLLWRQVLMLIAWAIIALILLGIVTVLHLTDEPTSVAASTGVIQGARNARESACSSRWPSTGHAPTLRGPQLVKAQNANRAASGIRHAPRADVRTRAALRRSLCALRETPRSRRAP